MGRIEELKEEYQKRAEEIDPLREPERVQLLWLWYLRERWHNDEKPSIFEFLQHQPKNSGLAKFCAYAEGELTDRELFDVVHETANRYVEILFNAGLLSEDLRGDPEYLAMMEEVALEAVKACRPLRGTAKLDECVVDPEAPTIWWRFVDQLHFMAGLPRVRAIREVMPTMTDGERALLDSDDFAGYALTDRERDALKRDLGLAAVRGLRRR